MMNPRHPLTVPVSERDHIAGPLDAPLQLVEYGDYECPFCGLAYPVVEEVRRLLANRLCFGFRQFPLVTAHPHALRAAEAAEAAGEQGEFWAMHARLFEHQDELSEEKLLSHAMGIGLDAVRFTAAMTDHRFIPRIREDLASGARSGVNGTPTFFVNGNRYDGPPAVGSLLAALGVQTTVGG